MRRPYASLVADLGGAPARLGATRLVCVDGPAGSGKTSFADRLALAAAAAGTHVAVVHLDDLYEGWGGLEGAWPRLAAQVLEPLGAGRPGGYRRYDWAGERWGEAVDVPVPRLLVVEGCGSARRAADPVATLRVWVEAPADLRLERGIARDGEAMRPRWLRWREEEAAHFAREATRERADLRVDGTAGDAAAYVTLDR